MLLHWMANFKCILCIFKIQNTVFVFKYIFPHSILYFYFKYILMYLCPSLIIYYNHGRSQALKICEVRGGGGGGIGIGTTPLLNIAQ